MSTLMYQEIFPFIGSALKRFTKAPKCYLLNNGLISFLSGISDYPSLQKTGLIGHRFENWFLQTLHILLDQQVGQHHIYYWRTSGGVEVDFVVDKKPYVFPFEVTFGDKVEAKKVRNLKQFLATEPRAIMGFYIYNGVYLYDAEARIHFVPAFSV